MILLQVGAANLNINLHIIHKIARIGIRPDDQACKPEFIKQTFPSLAHTAFAYHHQAINSLFSKHNDEQILYLCISGKRFVKGVFYIQLQLCIKNNRA